MENWLFDAVRYIFYNRGTLLVGGAIVVGVVIFLMGVFKKLVGNRISNANVRKTILAFLSIALVIPITALHISIQGFGYDSYWIRVILNTISTVLVYWVYECTHCRELLNLIGKNTVDLFIKFLFSEKKKEESFEESASDLFLEARKTATEILKASEKEEHAHKYDDSINI